MLPFVYNVRLRRLGNFERKNSANLTVRQQLGLTCYVFDVIAAQGLDLPYGIFEKTCELPLLLLLLKLARLCAAMVSKTRMIRVVRSSMPLRGINMNRRH